jgi:hypothetical protein
MWSSFVSLRVGQSRCASSFPFRVPKMKATGCNILSGKQRKVVWWFRHHRNLAVPDRKLLHWNYVARPRSTSSPRSNNSLPANKRRMDRSFPGGIALLFLNRRNSQFLCSDTSNPVSHSDSWHSSRFCVLCLLSWCRDDLVWKSKFFEVLLVIQTNWNQLTRSCWASARTFWKVSSNPGREDCWIAGI